MSTIKEEQFVDVFKNSLKITARTISVKTLLSDRNLRRINYKPYYQRNYVWDNVKQTFFIESVILGTEIPPLILYKSNTTIEVIDGRQRFETLKKFKENNISLTSKGLLALPALGKKTFNKLNDELKEIFWNSNIRIFEFEVITEVSPEIEDKIKKEIFRRYNTGITPLTTIEVDSAKYDSDTLSELFEDDLKNDESYYTRIKNCFFPNDSKSNDLLGKTVDFMRRAYTLTRFPISRYATGSGRDEIIALLYETTVNEIEDIELENRKFKQQILVVLDLYSKLSENSVLTKNKLLYESILWAIRILDEENINLQIADSISVIKEHYIKNIYKYSDDNSFFYKNIIDRFEDTAHLFRKLTGFSFEIYLRKSDFMNEIKTLRQSDSDAKDVINQLEGLRINKPSPVSKPIEEILSDVATNKYLIRPSYQRQERVSINKASSIIESLLLGIYLPPIFVFKRKNNTKEVIDGQQRLLSVIAFLGKEYRNEEDKLSYSKFSSFKLKGLKVLSGLNGSNYSSLSDSDKDKILDFVIDEIIIEENLNQGFDPTDLFIRLNQKPYPIEQNSFEMWNSTVDKDVIQEIKEVTNKHISWFYSKDNEDTNNRTDRMENEELITLLSYISYSINKDKSYDKVLGLFKRIDRITCRVKDKTAITDYLTKLEDNQSDKEQFVKYVKHTDYLIFEFKKLFGDNPTKDEINDFFNVKKAKTFRRSYQDFYITWLIFNSIDFANIAIDKENIKNKIHKMLCLLRNAENKIVDEEYFLNFINELNKTIGFN